MFHRHKWKEHARTFAPPCPGIKMSNATEHLVLAMASGLTTILFVCEDLECSAIRNTEMLGQVVK